MAAVDTLPASASSAPASQQSKIKIALGDLTPNNLKQLQTINSVVLTVKYADKFYKDALEAGELAKLAYMNDVCIGAVVAKREPVAQGSKEMRVHILTIAVLAPYRRLGVGSKLLNHIMSSTKLPLVVHVSVLNEDAVRFYERHGFTKKEKVEGYYRERDVGSEEAWLMVREQTKA